MLAGLGYATLDELIDAAVPAAIREHAPLALGDGLSEPEALDRLRALGARNEVFTSLIGLGYSDTITPGVILRNVLENPAWYTAYTPYQPEISQGRLEALVNFQTMVTDLTGMEIANASMLDEATAAAEAMALLHRVNGAAGDVFFVDSDCLPQTIAVVRTRAEPLGITVLVADPIGERHPAGLLRDPAAVSRSQWSRARPRARRSSVRTKRAHGSRLPPICSRSPCSSRRVRSGADVVVGSSQRFGVPLGFGGPHAAYFATRDEFKRTLPGRLVGVSIDAEGRAAYRLTLQTREQHIRREKATSNICTAQVLLAVIAGLYASYHGASGLRAIASRVHGLACTLAASLRAAGMRRVVRRLLRHHHGARAGTRRRDRRRGPIPAHQPARGRRRHPRPSRSTRPRRSRSSSRCAHAFGAPVVDAPGAESFPPELRRTSEFLTHPVFSTHRSEHQMLRYLRRARRPRSRARPYDDPARLVHDEAQRDRRDGARHLARVGAHPSRSRPPNRWAAIAS